MDGELELSSMLCHLSEHLRPATRLTRVCLQLKM